MDFKINQQERDALKGLPHLPRLTYLEAIRPYMDYSTGIVGIKRGISYQSLREELYVETQRGKAGGSPSKDQMRRVVKSLARAGLVSIQSEDKQLILKCELASWDNSEQNLLARRAPHGATTRAPSKNISKTQGCDIQSAKADTSKKTLPATPPVSGIYIVFLCDAFEKFWLMYPVKQSKAKAWETFQALAPTAELFDVMIKALEAQCTYRKEAEKHGSWMPHWKHAANWLTQRSWEDELPAFTFLSEEVNNANSKKSFKSRSSDALWEYCKDAFVDECEEPSNVISLGEFKQKQCSY